MDEQGRREQRERLELYLIGVFKAARHVDLADDAAAMRRIVDLATKVQIDHEANPRIGFEANLKGGASSLELNVTLSPDELAAVFSGKLVMHNTESAHDTETVRVHEPPQQVRAAPSAPQPREDGKALARGLIGGIIIMSASFAYYLKGHKEHHDDEKKTEDRHARTSGTSTAVTTTTAPTPDPPPTWVRVPSCTCVARGDSIKNTFILGAPTAHESVWYFDWTQYSTMLTSHRTLMLGRAEAGASAVLPPVAGVDTLRLTLACDGDIAALVSGNIASGWAGNDEGQLIWTTKLPAALAHATDAGVFAPSPMEAAFDVACTQVLTATQGLVKLDLANGKHVSLSMHDGTLH